MKRLKLPGMIEMPKMYSRNFGDLRYMRGNIKSGGEVDNTSLPTIDNSIDTNTDMTLPTLPTLPEPTLNQNDYVRNKVEEDILKREEDIKALNERTQKRNSLLASPILKKLNQKDTDNKLAAIEREKANIENTVKNPNVIQRYQAEYQAEKDFDKKQQDVQAQGGLMKGLGRAWYKASDSVMPGAVYKNSKLKVYEDIDTGSKVGNLAADFVGNTVGLAMPTANSGMSEMNVADDFAEFGAKKLMPKVATKGQRIAQNTVRGAIDGAIGGTIDTAREYIQTGEFNPVENIAMGTVGGAALFGGNKAITEGIDHVNILRDINKLNNGKDITVPQKPPQAIHDTQVPGPKVEHKVEAPKTEAPQEPIMKQEPPQEVVKPINDIKQPQETKPLTEPDKATKSDKTVLEKNVEDLEQEIMLGEQMGYPKKELENLRKDLELAKAERDKYLPQLKTPTVEAPTNDIPKLETPKVDMPQGTPKVTIRKSKVEVESDNNWSSMPLKDRSIENVGKKKVNAMQYDYPELKTHIQEEAKGTLYHLDNSIPGERTAIYNNDTGENIITGVKKQVSPLIEDIQEALRSPSGRTTPYRDIRKGLNDIIEDHGKENNANAKKIEQVLDEHLSKGGYTVEGHKLEPNKEYIEAKKILMDMENQPKTTHKTFFNEKVFSGYVPDKPKLPDETKVETTPTKAAEVKDYTIPEQSNNNIDMQLFGAKTENGKPVSDFKTNTLKKSEFLQNEKAQETIDDIAATYDIKTNKETLRKAQEELEFDAQSTITRIAETGLEDAEDVVAATIITNDLVAKKDFKGLKDWLKIVQPEITNIAQSLQAVSVWKKFTPEGTLLKAQKIVDIVNKKVEMDNPTAFKETTAKIEELEKQIKDLLAITDGKTEPGSTKKTKKAKGELTPEELKIQEIEKQIDKLLAKNKMARLTENDIELITKYMEKYNELPKGSQEQAEALAYAKKILAEKIPPKTSDKLLAYQRINLLGNSKTMVRNVGGNVFMGGLENAKDGLFGIAIDKGISKLTESNLGKKLPSELRGQRTLMGLGLKEQAKGFVEGVKITKSDMKKGIDTSKLQGQYEVPQSQAFRLKEGELKHIVNNTLSRAEKLVNYGLKFGDTPFVEAAYRGELYNQMKIKGTKEVTDEMIEKALEVAADRTFQNTNKLVKSMKNIQKGLNFGKDFGLGNIVMPYVKTPANVLDKAIDYSPIGGIKGVTNLINGMKKGTLDQRKVVNQLSRGLTGSALMYLGYKMAEGGVLQGKGADDMEAAAVEKQSGKMPYSIKIGNTHYTIDWIQPFAIPLMIGADTYKGKKDEEGITKTIYEAIKSGGSTLFDQSLLTGIADMFKGYSTSGGENLMEGLTKTAANAATQAVPFGSALKQVTQLTDNKQRDSSGDNIIEQTKNKIQSNIPILSKKLPEKIDTVGQPIEKHNGSKGIEYVFNTLINPGQIVKNNPSEAEKLALNLYEATGETKQMPRLADKEITYKDKDGNKAKYKLTAAEKNQLQKVMGKTTEKYFAEYYKTNKGKKLEDPIKDLQNLLTDIEKAAKEDFLIKKGLIQKN